MLLIKFFINLTFIVMSIGYLITLIHAIKNKNLKASLLMLFIPFYVFYYIFKLPENKLKKYLAITCIGSFWVFFFLGILEIVFTPPV